MQIFSKSFKINNMDIIAATSFFFNAILRKLEGAALQFALNVT